MEWIKNNLSLVSIVMLILGTFRIIVYYKMFQIDIVSFLEFSEIFQIEYLFFVVLFLILYFLFLLLSRPTIKLYNKVFGNTQEELESILEEISKKEREMESIKLRIGETENDIKNKQDYLGYKELKKTHEEIVDRHNEIKKRHNNIRQRFNTVKKESVTFVGILLYMLVLSCSLGYSIYEAMSIKRGNSKYEVSMLVDDKPIKTSESYMYIGRTKSYIFFYNAKAVESDVFANDDVKNLKFSEGKDYTSVIGKKEKRSTITDKPLTPTTSDTTGKHR